MKSIRLLAILAICVVALANTFQLLGQSPVEVERVKAETQMLHAESDKLQAEAASLRRPAFESLLPSLIGFGAILTSVIVGLWQLHQQRLMQNERAKVDTSLKAVEIVMNSPSSSQVHARAKIIKVLFCDLIPDFEAHLNEVDWHSIGYASYRARFLNLLDDIAGKPQDALLIAEAYNILFPEDHKLGHQIADLITMLKERNAAPQSATAGSAES